MEYDINCASGDTSTVILLFARTVQWSVSQIGIHLFARTVQCPMVAVYTWITPLLPESTRITFTKSICIQVVAWETPRIRGTKFKSKQGIIGLPPIVFWVANSRMT